MARATLTNAQALDGDGLERVTEDVEVNVPT